MKKQLCFLFDIDGTLLTIGHRGRQAFCSAVAQVLKVEPQGFYPQMAGRTDLSLVHEALEFYQQPWSTEIARQIFCTYVNLLQISLEEPQTVTVFSGARELLSALQEKGAVIALGTGNIQDGARIKMTRAALWPYVIAGGYGDDDTDRARVLAKGVERAGAAIGQKEFAQVWVIGDTPLDIAAARQIGARVCAIANGAYTVADLLPYHPDLCYPDLPQAHEELLQLLSTISD